MLPIVDILGTALINPSDGVNYWFITVVLSIACLLLLVAVVYKCYM